MTRSGSESGRGNREARVTALLAVAAAPRERVLDEHMYTVDRGQHRKPATFRLQLFTAPGARPVAIVIQHLREDGALINERERYAEAVWRQHCPDEAEPPIWVDRLLFPWREDEWFTVVSFPVTGPYQLDEPGGRTRITVPEIARLLGIPPDISRGTGFHPRPSTPEPLPTYSAEWVLRIPRPAPFRNRRCMPPRRPWWRDALRQLAPRNTGRDCCWMHKGNWHQVSKTAITLVRRAQRDGIVGEDICGHVLAQARADGVSGWQLDALECLVNCYDGIQLDTGDDGRRFFINGQHKTRAMLDQGVRRTIIVQWRLPAQP